MPDFVPSLRRASWWSGGIDWVANVLMQMLGSL